MSAFTHAEVHCDHFDEAKPPGQRICHESVEAGWTKAEARREARKLGWAVRVRARSAKPGGDFDYCPAHKYETSP